MADSMSIDSKKPSPDQSASSQHYHQQHSGHGSDESVTSSPERDTLPPLPNSSNGAAGQLLPDGQQPKRKGGRKPVSDKRREPV